jgi:hypothetical protein
VFCTARSSLCTVSWSLLTVAFADAMLASCVAGLTAAPLDDPLELWVEPPDEAPPLGAACVLCVVVVLGAGAFCVVVFVVVVFVVVGVVVVGLVVVGPVVAGAVAVGVVGCVGLAAAAVAVSSAMY